MTCVSDRRGRQGKKRGGGVEGSKGLTVLLEKIKPNCESIAKGKCKIYLTHWLSKYTHCIKNFLLCLPQFEIELGSAKKSGRISHPSQDHCIATAAAAAAAATASAVVGLVGIKSEFVVIAGSVPPSSSSSVRPSQKLLPTAAADSQPRGRRPHRFPTLFAKQFLCGKRDYYLGLN